MITPSAPVAGHDPRVFPTVADLLPLQQAARDFRLLSGRPHAYASGRHTADMRSRGMDFREIRPYQPGDNIRRIDWRTSSRTGSVMVRFHEDTHDLPLTVFVDLRPTMFFGSRAQTKAATALSVAALALFHQLENNGRSGAVILTAQGCVILPVGRGKRHCLRILAHLVDANRTLATAPADPAQRSRLEPALRDLARCTPPRSAVLAISDFSGLTHTAMDTMADISRTAHVQAVRIRDPMEADPPSAPGLLARDPRTGEVADLSNPAATRRFSDFRADAAAAQQAAFARHGLLLHDLDCTQPLAPQLRAAILHAGATS